MAITLPKTRDVTTTRSLFVSSFAIVSVGGLALFLMIASLLLVSNPIGSTIHEYLLGVEHFREPSQVVSPCENQTRVPSRLQQPSEKGNPGMIMGEFAPVLEVSSGLPFAPAISFHETQEVRNSISPVPIISNGEVEIGRTFSSGIIDFIKNNSKSSSDGSTHLKLKPEVPYLASPPSSNSVKDELRSCDLYQGKWIHDPAGPLYTNNTCPFIIQSQNCQGNGRPDKDYENWRWKPDQCDLPRFDARKFLELMKGKTLVFVGDSLARNQLESMLCILWQAEAPKRRMNGQMHQWYFRSTSTTIGIIWSAWLVHKTTDPLPSTPEGLDKIHLDVPDETLMTFLPKLDVVVLSSGHWFSKPSAYLRKGKIVGGQLWHPKRSRKKQINNVKAYSIATETTLNAIATMPNYTGLTIVRSYSPDHYSGGAWNTGGKCGGIDRPVSNLARNEHTEVMHMKQVTGFERAMKKVRNGSKMRLMEITEAFGYRPDAHPGPYCAPKNIGPDGKPRSEDCVHWCLPGAVDTWNEILLEIIRREF